jgi:hypothetical protein
MIKSFVSEDILKKLQEQYENEQILIDYYKNRKTFLTNLINKKIHIKSRQGIYTVKRVTKNKLCLTCKSWYDKKEMWVDNFDFKCLAGGFHNLNL